MRGGLDRRPAARSSSQSGSSPTTAARLSRMVVVACRRLRRSWASPSALARCGRERLIAAQVAHLAGVRRRAVAGCRHAEERAHAVTPSVAARISARCTVRVPVRSRRQPAADVHQAGGVAGGAAPRRRCRARSHLVGEHRRRGVGVLHREGAAEAAALVGAGQLDQVDAAHRAQQPQRLVADAQHPQRVAGRVVGDPVREVGADVGHAEHVDQELGQLVASWPRPPRARAASASSPSRRATAACWWRTDADARARRRHDRVVRRRTPRRGGGRAAAPAPGSRC